MRRASELQKRADRADAKASAVQKELATTKAHAAEVSRRAETLDKDLRAARGDRATLEHKLGETQRRAESASEELARQEREAKRAQERVAQLESQLSTLRDRAERGDKGAASELASLEKERDTKERDLKAAQNDLDDATKRAHMAHTRAEQLESRLSSRDAEIASLKKHVERVERERAEALQARALRPAAKAVPVDPLGPNIVRDIRLETAGGRSRIVVELERPSRFETMPGRDSRAVMILNDATLPVELERTLSAQAQGGAVRFVSSFAQGEHVRMEAEIDGKVAETIHHEGNKLVWEFAPDQVQAQARVPSQSAAPKRSTEGGVLTSAPPLIVTDPSKVSRVPGMSRKRLTIDLREVDIENVLRLISKEGGVNIIAGDDVQGSVTMRLQSVPLEQVFLTILQSRSLGFEMRGVGHSCRLPGHPECRGGRTC